MTSIQCMENNNHEIRNQARAAVTRGPDKLLTLMRVFPIQTTRQICHFTSEHPVRSGSRHSAGTTF
jgi:hypothetical protein